MFIDIEKPNIQVYYNLSQAYEAEFSPFTKSLPDKNGVYPVSTMIDEIHKGFLYCENEIPLGFVVVNIGKPVFDVCEFYVLPSHRKKNIGKLMAFYVFDKFTGEWEVKQIQGVEYATEFWRKVIAEYTAGKFEEDIYIDKKWGKVTRQRFKTSNANVQLKPD